MLATYAHVSIYVLYGMQVSLRIDEIFAKESDPFTTNEGMLDVINTIRFRHFDAAIDAALAAAGDKVKLIDIMHINICLFPIMCSNDERSQQTEEIKVLFRG
jgi:hypothetical protein